MQTTFEEFWTQCLRLIRTEKQREIMMTNAYQPGYRRYWEEGKSAEEVMEEEWG